jgi:hypothetical protein
LHTSIAIDDSSIARSGTYQRQSKMKKKPDTISGFFKNQNLNSEIKNRLLFFLFDLFFLVLSDDLLLDIWRDRLVVAQFHRITALAAGDAFELAVVLRYF